MRWAKRLREVPCPTCGVGVDESCRALEPPHHVVQGTHGARRDARAEMDTKHRTALASLGLS